MNTWQTLGAVTVAAILGGAVGGFVIGSRGSEEPARGPKLTTLREALDETDGEPAADPDAAELEVEALRGRLASLERRVSLLTAAMARGEAPAEGEAAGTSPREADVADPVFEAAVLDIMDRERERADGERETRRAELRTERRQRISDDLAGKLGLDDPQKARIGELITAHFDALRALRSDDNPERPVTPREWRERAAQLDQVLQQGLAEVLTPKQLAAYQALDPDDQIGGSFGRGRGGGPRTDASSAPAPVGPPR